MMHPPDSDAIRVAELRVAHSVLETQHRLHRVRAAFRATLAKPTTLVLAAGAGGLVGFWLAGRPRGVAARVSGSPTRGATAGGVVAGFAVRYVMQRLPLILSQVWAARRSSAEASDRSSMEPVDAKT